MFRLKVMVLLFSAIGAAQAETIAIVSPQSGQVLVPGSSTELSVTFPPGFTPAEVNIEWVRVGYFEFHSQTVDVAPFSQITAQVPSSLSGPIRLSVSAMSIDGTHADGDVPVVLRPADPPTRIDPVVTVSVLKTPGAAGSMGERELLRPEGVYGDGTVRDISSPLVGTTYTSLDSSVATVTAEGEVQSVSRGVTFVQIDNRGVKAYVPVYVQDSYTARPPARDLSGAVSVTAGGFRVDRERGLYLQQVSVTNASGQILDSHIVLLLENLTPGVSVKNGDVARHLVPGVSVIFLAKEAPTFMPGETVLQTVEFVNPDNLPITYTPHTYWSMDP